MNYYNEFDPQSAAWIRELIDRGLIPTGDVDTRSIIEVTPSDLHGYTQCHFFAGISGWPLALKLAGIPATRSLWTGSCPCQPFSVAGEGKGIEDDRHLWPVFFGLIRECRPERIFGEQVASAAVLGSASKPTKRDAAKAIQPVWLDGVFTDLESAGYACGSSDIPAAGIGAPHIRQRCYWGAVRMADSHSGGLSEHPKLDGDTSQPGFEASCRSDIGGRCEHVGMADSGSERREGRERNGAAGETRLSVGYVGECGGDCGMADSTLSGCEGIGRGGENGTPEHCEPIRMGHTPSGGLGIIGDASLAGSCGHAHGSGDVCGVGDSHGESTGRHAGSAHAAEAEHGSGESDGHRPFDAGDGLSGGLCNSPLDGCEVRPELHGEHDGARSIEGCGPDGRLANTERDGGRADEQERGQEGGNVDRRVSHWDDAYWQPCRDGKYRRVPIESVFQPLADGIPDGMGTGWSDCAQEIQELAEALQAFPLANPEGFKVKPRGSVRPGLLKGSGNAIVPQVAAEFVTAFIQTTE